MVYHISLVHIAIAGTIIGTIIIVYNVKGLLSPSWRNPRDPWGGGLGRSQGEEEAVMGDGYGLADRKRGMGKAMRAKEGARKGKERARMARARATEAKGMRAKEAKGMRAKEGKLQGQEVMARGQTEQEAMARVKAKCKGMATEAMAMATAHGSQ